MQNPQMQLAKEFIRATSHSVFLTGKAGTGKTTFLHALKEDLPKRMIVTAPTGVAAINAGGVTLHSFFQLPFGPFVPGSEVEHRAAEGRFSRQKREIIQSLRKTLRQAVDELRKVVAIKNACLESCRERFSTSAYLGALGKARIDTESTGPLVEKGLDAHPGDAESDGAGGTGALARPQGARPERKSATALPATGSSPGPFSDRSPIPCRTVPRHWLPSGASVSPPSSATARRYWASSRTTAGATASTLRPSLAQGSSARARQAQEKAIPD